MSDLTQLLTERLAFSLSNRMTRTDSAFDEHARTSPLIALLVEAVAISQELRIYCLGSDASTMNMIRRYDEALARIRKALESK